MTATASTCPDCGGTYIGDICKLCEMFASGTPPQCHTDSTFFTGDVVDGKMISPGSGGQFADNPKVGDWLAKRAKAQGLKRTNGLIYMSRF